MKKTRVFVIGLDGTPHSLLAEKMARGEMPNVARLVRAGTLRRMMTTIPPISPVAWTTFATGVNPGEHRIFGFTDRRTSPMEAFIPDGARRASPTLWRILSGAGKRVCVINVPATYPPERVNGSLVSGFPAMNLEKATYPPELSVELKEMNYVIDVDTWKVREDRDAFLDDLFDALEKRLRATLRLMKSSRWDFFISHVMETDRINHFFYEFMETGDRRYGGRVHEFYAAVDGFVGEVCGEIPDDAVIIVLSDHGFCALKKEVNLNHLLKEAGLLSLKSDAPKSVAGVQDASTAYSLPPGRIYINLKGREATGSIERGRPAENAIAGISELLLGLRDPDTGDPVIRQLHRREEIYRGQYLHEAADIIALPHNGYDLKAHFDGDRLMSKDFLRGMHTHDDAFVFVKGREVKEIAPHIMDMAPSILNLFGIQPAGMEGRAIFG